MTRLYFKPIAVGSLMGLMMIWMLHNQIGSDAERVLIQGAIVFVGLHVLLASTLVAISMFAASLSPRLRFWLQKLHRPALGHVVAMVMGMALAAGLFHLIMHGFSH